MGGVKCCITACWDDLWTGCGRDMDGISLFLYRNLHISLKSHNFVSTKITLIFNSYEKNGICLFVGTFVILFQSMCQTCGTSHSNQSREYLSCIRQWEEHDLSNDNEYGTFCQKLLGLHKNR